jgi:hypothetical protein
MNRKEIVAVLIAAFIILISFALDLDYFPSAILWAIAGFTAAFIVGKGIKNGILLGFLAVLIASVPIFVLFGDLVLKPAGILFIAYFIVLMAMFCIPGGIIGGLVNRWKHKTIEKNKFIISIVSSVCFLLLLFSLLSKSYFNILIISLIILLTSLTVFIFYLISRKLPGKYRLFFTLAILLIFPLYNIYQGDNVIFIFTLLILAAALFYIARKVQNKKNEHKDIKIK